MAKSPGFVSLATITLEAESLVPLHRQLYNRIREAILNRELVAGGRLPSTRALAAELGISRSTVLNAFEQLLAEGYLEGKVGAGTYVARSLPDELLNTRANPKPEPSLNSKPKPLAESTLKMATTLVNLPQGKGDPRAFRTGLPAFDAFPFEIWARLSAQRWRNPPRELLGYGDPAGYFPLRRSISEYLGAARGVHCEPEQIIIISGSQQGLDLAARILLQPGDAAWIEDPGYLGARGAFLSAGAQLIPVPVDKEGLDVAAGIATEPTARMVYVSPSHQYPLGVTMSLKRRLALLEWASQAAMWILEDDYDSEYRYAGRPLAALQGLDKDGRVLYIGTFSKVLFPSLRLGYLVVPPELVETFVRARALSDRHSPSMEQAFLADFIDQGHFARHIRRMRALYAERQEILVSAAQKDLAGLLEVDRAEAGMHLVGWLNPAIDDQVSSNRALTFGVDASALSSFCMEVKLRPALLLGYAGLPEPDIREGVKKLKQALLSGTK
jgi:GntR family transcriptional regulator / MocR family aminotransferase